MKVVSIRRKEFLGKYVSQARETVPDGAKLLAGVGLTVWVPALLYYVASGQLLLLYLTAGTEVFGAILGFCMFKKSFAGFLSCVPMDRVTNVGRVSVNKQKAA